MALPELSGGFAALVPHGLKEGVGEQENALFKENSGVLLGLGGGGVLLGGRGDDDEALREHTELVVITEDKQLHLRAETNHGTFTPGIIVRTQGAWAHPQVRPAKGQMLRVQLPATLPLCEVHRSEHIYVVPRTQGPQAGTALIGATVEDAGFDTMVHPAGLAHLRTLAAELLPQLADEAIAPQVEAWAGLRPATADSLPLLGPLSHGQFIAAGHFRNGILLAPATAVVMADLIEGKSPAVDLTPFSPDRFTAT